MFKNTSAFTSFSVDDLGKAKKFYGETLGLNVQEQAGMGLAIKLGTGGDLFLYSKPDHQPATFTVLNFKVDDLEGTVAALRAQGVKFEQYDGEIKTDEKGIFRSKSPEQGPSIAWFRDPAGNILSVLQ